MSSDQRSQSLIKVAEYALNVSVLGLLIGTAPHLEVTTYEQNVETVIENLIQSESILKGSHHRQERTTPVQFVIKILRMAVS